MIYRYTILGFGALLLDGCSVYTPMLGAAPEIRSKGQLEATAAWSLTNRFDVGATYSPVRHLLVRAAASHKLPLNAANGPYKYARINQYELAAGTYWPLGQRGLVGGLAAFGQAHAQARYTNDDEDGYAMDRQLPTNIVPHQFDAFYNKYSAETYGR